MILEFPPSAEYEAIFEAMSAGVVLIGADGRFLRANRAYCAMTGYGAAELLAMSYRELNHPDDLAQSEAAAADLLEGRRDTVRLEQRTRHRAGHYLWVYSTTTLRRNAASGNPEYAISVVEDISERKTAEAAHACIRDELAASLQLTQSVLDHSLDVICILGPDGRFVRTSRSSGKVWGYASEELRGRPFQELLHPDDIAASLRVAGELAAGLPAVNFENRHLHRDGTVVDMLWNATWSDEHQTMIAIGRDVSRIKRALLQVEDSEQRFRSFFEYHPDAIFSLDMTPRLVAVNEAMVQLSGYSREELLSPQPPSLAAPECLDDAVRALYAAMAGEVVKYHGIGIRKDGTRFETVTVHFPMVVDGRIAGVHGIAKDVTQANENERRIRHLATHDALTGLPNRNLLEDRLLHAVEQARRIGCRMGVLFLDLNRFKVVNDSLGHDKGDALLQTVAARLRAVVREGDTVARLGGDEFVILLENVGGIDDISAIAESVLDVVRLPMRLGGHDVSVSTSIGASVYPKDGDDASTLLKHADTAMYRAKEVGQGVFRFYDVDMNIKVLERLLTENGLRQAIDKGQLVLHYQPRLLVASRRICGAEALIRWQHPEKGLIPPSDFVPLAEEIGLINTIGEWVLRTACRQAQAWRANGIAPFRVSVNLSAKQVVSADLVGIVCAALRDSGLDPEWLELELTESGLIDGLDATTAALRQLRTAGVSIAIDDFGTGYSSLSYLKQLPIDALKIDRSFLSGVPVDRNDTAIVNATIVMAHQMGLRVIAEGVNTGAQVGVLSRLGCDEMQGYGFGRPVAADEFTELLVSQATAATG